MPATPRRSPGYWPLCSERGSARQISPRAATAWCTPARASLLRLLIDSARLAAINELRELAPLHNGFGLDAIAAMRAAAPALPQVACFDTAFHAPCLKWPCAMPCRRRCTRRGYRRFGFHGLNFEHVTAMLAEQHGAAATARLLIFHLGNGCSLCAVRDGQSVATTMGYSTLDGLVMGTRCGVDRSRRAARRCSASEGLSLEALEALLYRGSGLLALSGVSSDMREIERLDNEACRFAIEHFCYWAARHAGSLAVALGGHRLHRFQRRHRQLTAPGCGPGSSVTCNGSASRSIRSAMQAMPRL